MLKQTSQSNQKLVFRLFGCLPPIQLAKKAAEIDRSIVDGQAIAGPSTSPRKQLILQASDRSLASRLTLHRFPTRSKAYLTYKELRDKRGASRPPATQHSFHSHREQRKIFVGQGSNTPERAPTPEPLQVSKPSNRSKRSLTHTNLLERTHPSIEPPPNLQQVHQSRTKYQAGHNTEFDTAC